MTEHSREERALQDQKSVKVEPLADDEGCQYVHKHCNKAGQRCGWARHGNSQWCFWHNQNRQWLEDETDQRRKDLLRMILGGECLEGANLVLAPLDGLFLYYAKLQDAWLMRAQLNGAILFGSQLQGARLNLAQLRGAVLRDARFDERTSLANAVIDEQTDLTNVRWPRRKRCLAWRWRFPPVVVCRYAGDAPPCSRWCVPLGVDQRLADEREAKDAESFKIAAAVYRVIRRNYEAHGDYSIADEFRFREMECLRRTQPRWANYLVWTPFYKFLCGYGTKPLWTFWWLFGVWAIAGLLLPFLGITVAGDSERLTLAWHLPGIGEWAVLGHGVILSLASLATLTFSNLAPATKAGEFLASAEGLAGVLLAAVFIVSFARKMIR